MASSVTPRRKKLLGEIALSLAVQEEVGLRVKTVADFEKNFPQAQQKSTTELVDFLLASAVALNASDIHIEPTEAKAKLRFRIDGFLHDAGQLELTIYPQILSRLKIISTGIKLNVADRAQDGRFSFSLPDQGVIEVRVSSLPAEYGESIVMRVLNPQNLVRLEHLGLRKDLLELFQKEISRPNGMLITTGPTGSGKTTTLYAFLKEIHRPEIKIITIEDPIEYHLEGISQTQVNPEKGYDFATGLQAIVRQDPDILLVGEIRDSKTADIALQAALTGHFVLTTLHANDAIGTFARLQSLGAKIPTISSAVRLVIAQRLVRRICAQCMELAEATTKTKQEIQEVLREMPPSLRPHLPSPLLLPKANQCENCDFTGYQGRVGLFEAILVDDKMKEALLSSPSSSSLEKFAVKQGMVSMYQDGILKVLEHVTTIEEVQRETIE